MPYLTSTSREARKAKEQLGAFIHMSTITKKRSSHVIRPAECLCLTLREIMAHLPFFRKSWWRPRSAGARVIRLNAELLTFETQPNKTTEIKMQHARSIDYVHVRHNTASPQPSMVREKERGGEHSLSYSTAFQ